MCFISSAKEKKIIIIILYKILIYTLRKWSQAKTTIIFSKLSTSTKIICIFIIYIFILLEIKKKYTKISKT
jgi:hypothetical protein